MKKFYITSLVMIFCIAVSAANTNFTDALSNCSSYRESGVVNTEGMEVRSSKQILGWQNNKCVYKEVVNFGGNDTTITCKFTKPQINELSSVMRAYELVQQYSSEKVDTSSLDGVKDNPVVKAWGKYLQNKSVCTITGIQ